MNRSLTLVATAALCGPAAFAQGTAQLGNTAFTIATVPDACNSIEGLAEFSATGTNALFQHWWYYCIEGDDQACAFNSSQAQMWQNYGANLAFLRWDDVDGRGLMSATLAITVHPAGANGGVAISRMTLRNKTALPLTVHLYSYTDVDLCDTYEDDSAAGVMFDGHPVHTITDGDCVDTFTVHGVEMPGATLRDQVGVFPSVRNAILARGGGCPQLGPNFGSSGGRFVSDDYSGAFQWSVTIPGAGSVTAITAIAHNTALSSCMTAASITPIAGCETLGGFGRRGRLAGDLVPVVGNVGEVRLTNALPRTPAAIHINVGGSATYGCTPILGVNAMTPIHISVQRVTDFRGEASLLLRMSNDPAMCGNEWTLQGLWLDFGANAGIPVATTAPVLWTVGR